MNYTIETGLRAFTCDQCGATFGVPQAYYNGWADGRHGGKVVHCVCCGMRWTCGQTEKQKLEKQLAAERAAHDQTRASRNEWIKMEHQRSGQLRATKGVVTRMKRRLSHGVCPCCTRTFQNLRAHMRHRHPDYVNDAAAE